MRRRLFVRLAAVLVVSGAAITLGASAVAQGPSRPTGHVQPMQNGCVPPFGPARVPVGLVPTVVRFAVRTRCTSWELRIPAFAVDVTNEFPEAAFDPDRLHNTDVGPVSVDIRTRDASGEPGQRIVPYGFALRRGTSWGTTFHASPTQLKFGMPVHVSGTLVRADWDTGRYEACCAGATVDVQTYLDTWSTIATLHADSHGSVSGNVSTSGDHNYEGQWRLFFPGNSVAGASGSLPIEITLTH